MKEKKNYGASGFGLSGILTIIFVVLKLTKLINWSWVWVLSPIWIELLICFALILFLIIFKLVLTKKK